MSTIKKQGVKTPAIKIKIEIEDRFVNRAAKRLKRLYNGNRPLLRAEKVRICRLIITGIARQCMQSRKRLGSLDAELTLGDFKRALGKALSERRKEKKARQAERDARIPEPPPGYRFRDPMLTEAELAELKASNEEPCPAAFAERPTHRHAVERPQGPILQGDFIGDLFPACESS